MSGSNCLSLSLADNPELSALFAGKKSGDKICLNDLGKLYVQVAEATADRIDLNVVEIEAKEPEDVEESAEPGEGEPPNESGPVLKMTGFGRRENPLVEGDLD